MARVLICHIVPKHLTDKLITPQAPNNFCFNLQETNCFDNLYSIIPISYFDERIISGNGVIYFNGRKKSNKLFSIFSIAINNLQCALLARKIENIWFYNIVNANILCYLVLRYLFRKKVFVLLLDYTPKHNILSIQNYIPHLIKKSYGVISLSKRTKIANSNMDFIAGIIPMEKIQKRVHASKKKLSFLFSGILAKHTGFDLALDVFKQLPNYELFVSGFGDIESVDLNMYENIKYLGYLPYNEYIKVYDKVDICLSFRDPDFPENCNNFPSKILEYFSFNKIVISTINYPELSEFNFFSCDFNITSIISTIKHIDSLEDSHLQHFCDNVEALKNNFSEIKWKKTLQKIEDN